mmetsp:Transcript_104567/g.191700  ORF Transcript_104567/g.191700 Transcript_104567/m.191700 type:complete len:103 (+) Transcript_104567:456-764(+)
MQEARERQVQLSSPPGMKELEELESESSGQEHFHSHNRSHHQDIGRSSHHHLDTLAVVPVPVLASAQEHSEVREKEAAPAARWPDRQGEQRDLPRHLHPGLS